MASEASGTDVLIGDGPLTWVGVLADLLGSAGGGGGESSQKAGLPEVVEAPQGKVVALESKTAEPTPSASSSGAPAAKAAGVNGAATRETALVLLNDTGSGGAPAEVPVNGLLAVDFVEGVPVFEELAATSVGDADNRICVLDVRLQGEASSDAADDASRKFLCLRSLSTRVRVNGKPIGNKWLPLHEGDALGFGHIDAAESAARTVYAITYVAGDVQCRAHATAVAFARDRLAEYNIAVPLDVVRQSSISQLLRPERAKAAEPQEGERSAAAIDKGDGQPEKQQQQSHEVGDWASRAQKALQVLFAAGPIARAIASSSRKLFIEWAKDEASARGTSFETLDRVGIAISKCYEASAFIVPPATYWADEGLVKCMGLLRREAESGGEMGRAQQMLQERVQAALGEHEGQELDEGLAGLVARELAEEFDQQRCGDLEVGLDALVERVWKDVGLSKVRSFVGCSGEWARYHLDLRQRITGLSACSNFAEELRACIASVRRHRNRRFAADALNHALAVALVKKSADAIRAVVAELRASGSVDSSTFQAWLLQARRDARWPAISSASAFRSCIENGQDSPLVQAVLATMEEEGLRPSACVVDRSAEAQQAVLATMEKFLEDQGLRPIAGVEGRPAEAPIFSEPPAVATAEEHSSAAGRQEGAGEEATAASKGKVEQAGGARTTDQGQQAAGKSWHWLVATTKELTNDSRAHRPDAFNNLQKYIQRAIGLKDEGIVCIKWEHVQVFNDCHPLLGFVHKQDAFKALDSWDLASLQLVPVALAPPPAAAGGSGRPNAGEPKAPKAAAGKQPKRPSSPSSSEAVAKKRKKW